MKKIFFLGFLLIAVLMVYSQSAAPEDTLKQYTGKYKFPEGSVVTEVNITLDSGVLKAGSAMGSTDLRLQAGDVFDIVAYGGTATFRRSADNKITGVNIVVDDINMEGTKAEDSAYAMMAILPRFFLPVNCYYSFFCP